MQISQLPQSATFFISYKKPKPIIFIIITNANNTLLCSSSTNNSIIQLVINITDLSFSIKYYIIT